MVKPGEYYLDPTGDVLRWIVSVNNGQSQYRAWFADQTYRYSLSGNYYSTESDDWKLDQKISTDQAECLLKLWQSK